MTPLVGTLLGVAAIAAVVDWVAVGTYGSRPQAAERVAKPIVLASLLAAAIAWPEGTAEAAAVRPWLVAALTASLAGDVLLLAPGRFVAGLVAFLFGHIAYLVAFAQLPGSGSWLAAGAVLAGVVIVTVGRVLLTAAGRVGLAAPVAVYLVAICAMAVAATRSGIPAAFVGAWLFVASDAMLAWGRFRSPTPGSPRGVARLRVAVMATYHVGQVLLLVALVQ